MQQMTGLDASFIYFETPNAPMHVGSLSIYDPSTAPGGRVTFADILATIEQRLPRSRVFRQKAVRVPMDLDHPYWVEDRDFDLEFHVRHIALPAPGSWTQLATQAARLHSRPLDLTRPLWEIYVIEGLDQIEDVPAGAFALLQKTHHAAVDGVSGMEILSALHDLEPTPTTGAETDDWSPEPDPEPWSLLARAGVNNALRPMHFARVMRRTMPGLSRMQDRLRRQELRLPPLTVPRTRFNGPVSPHRVVEMCKLDLSAVRRAKASIPGSTVNDVVLATVGGALRHYLSAKGELPSESLVAMAPISVRSEDEKRSAGNQVSGMLVDLGTTVADPRERLLAVRQSTREQKELTNAMGARALTEYSQFLPGGLAALAARTAARYQMANRTVPMMNTVVTNVPGPQEPLYFGGARLLSLLGLGPVGDGMGLIHPITSYCGQLLIGVTSCREMVPDAAFYRQCIQRSFDELDAVTPGS